MKYEILQTEAPVKLADIAVDMTINSTERLQAWEALRARIDEIAQDWPRTESGDRVKISKALAMDIAHLGWKS